MKAEYALEWGQSSGGLPGRVLCVLGPGKKSDPGMVMYVAVCPKEEINLLNCPFHLPGQLNVGS